MRAIATRTRTRARARPHVRALVLCMNAHTHITSRARACDVVVPARLFGNSLGSLCALPLGCASYVHTHTPHAHAQAQHQQRCPLHTLTWQCPWGFPRSLLP